jgi:signal transduction histidine kinase
MLSKLRAYFSSLSYERRSYGIVFFVLGLLALLFAGERLATAYCSQHWDVVVERESNKQLEAVRVAFTGLQRRVRRIATELARHDDVTKFLSGQSSDRPRLFARAARISQTQDVSAEVYDTTGAMVAWQGRSGVVEQREIRNALRGFLTSYISRGPIFSHLFVITPVRNDSAIVGAVLIRQAVEVSYPLSNKFITPAGLTAQLSRDLGVSVEIEYGENAAGRKDGRYISTALRGIDDRKLAAASILRISRSAYLERVSDWFANARASLFIVLLVIVGVLGVRFIARLRSVVLQCFAVTALIWLARYALLWLDIPASFVQIDVFDPKHFASKFGGGIAKSIGELTMTTLALLTNTTLIARIVIKRQPSSPPLLRRLPLPFRILVGAGITTVIYLMVRAYAATIRSAVYDSRLKFNDPKIVTPSFDLALMAFDLFVISFCAIIVALALTSFMIRLFARDEGKHATGATPWAIVGALFVLASILFGVLQETPLMSTPFRLLFGAAILLFTMRVRKSRRVRSPISFANAVIVLALSALFFYPLLAENIQERDRTSVEVFARELTRPADTWLKFVVNESLQSFVSEETFDALLNGSGDQLKRLAFTCWARSTVARLGYAGAFVVYDAQGTERSRFTIGAQSPRVAEALAAASTDTMRQIMEFHEGLGVNDRRTYAGSMRIVASDQLLGTGVIVISSGSQALFRGETPTVLRTETQESIESFYRAVSVNEFRDGTPLPSVRSPLPIGYALPAAAQTHFADTLAPPLWLIESIGGSKYETFFMRRGPKELLALRMELLDARAHLFGIVRTTVYYFLILAAAVVIILLFLWARGTPYRFTFRDKLLLTLLAIALIPVVVISTFTRVFARDRVMAALSQQLEQETSLVEREMVSGELFPNISNGGRSFELLPQADFNYYVGRQLVTSSRTELYEAGILDRRLNGSAYRSLFTEGNRFHLETENIGLYRYAVGYRPTLDSNMQIAGVLAVPTLYRQERIDEEVARTNALLFGVTAIVFLAVALVATAFANRIAAPIHKLTEATKRVSLGDLNVPVNARADGEIGELIRSFGTMTRDLQRSRENLVQYERELAWKEMAKQVAHEIKNPLTPMKLAIQHLRQTYRDKVENFDEIFDEVTQMVIRQVDALSRIASEFSSFARMPKSKLEKLSVNDVLREAAYLFEQDDRITCETTLQPHLPPIMADREELRRAFINIIRNGVQAMNGEGRIIISSMLHPDNIEIRIRDFGSGIPDEIRGKLFQPNFSTKTDGMGLGLAIVKKTLEDMNGTIELESVMNEGTTVIIHISLKQENHESAFHHSS